MEIHTIYTERKTLPRRTFCITIMLMLALILAVFISLLAASRGVTDSYANFQSDLYGHQDAIVLNIQHMPDSSAEIDTLGYFSVFGVTPLPDGTAGIPIVLGTADETALGLCNLHLIEGRFPKNESEIIIENWVASALGLIGKVGELVRLDFNTLVVTGDVGAFAQAQSQEFMLTGIIDNYSSVYVEWDYSRLPQHEGERLPAVIVGGDRGFLCPTVHAAVKSNLSGEELSRLFKTSAHYVFQNKGNNTLDMFRSDQQKMMDKQQNVMDAVCVLFGIVGLSLWVLFIFLFAYNTAKSLPRLYTLGAAKQQLFIYQFTQIAVVVTAAIAVGILLSFVLTLVTATVMQNILGISVRVIPNMFDAIAPVLTASTAGLVVSSFLSRYYTIKTTSENRKWLKTGIWRIVSKNPAKRRIYRGNSAVNLLLRREVGVSKVRFIIAAISIAASLILINEAVMEYSHIMSFRSSSCDIVLSGYFSESAGYLATPAGDPAGIPIEYFSDIASNSQVSDYLLVKRESVNIIAEFEDKPLWDELLPFDKSRPIYLEEKGDYDAELKRFGYPQDAIIYKSKVCELEPHIINMLTGYQHIGSIRENELRSGSEMLVLVSDDEYQQNTDVLNNLVGKSIVWTRIFDFEAEQPKRIDFALSVAAIVIVPTTNALMNEAFSDGPNFVVFGDMLEKAGLPALCDRVYLMLKDPSADTSVLDKQIYSVLSSNGDMQYRSNKYAAAAAKKEYQFTVLLMMCVIIPLLGLAFSLIIIGHVSRMNERREIYKQLYVLGMNPRQINRLLIRSYLLYLSTAYMVYAIVLVFLLRDPWYLGRMNVQVMLVNLIVAGLLVGVGLPLMVYQKKWIKTHICYQHI